MRIAHFTILPMATYSSKRTRNYFQFLTEFSTVCHIYLSFDLHWHVACPMSMFSINSAIHWIYWFIKMNHFSTIFGITAGYSIVWLRYSYSYMHELIRTIALSQSITHRNSHRLLHSTYVLCMKNNGIHEHDTAWNACNEELLPSSFYLIFCLVQPVFQSRTLTCMCARSGSKIHKIRNQQ